MTLLQLFQEITKIDVRANTTVRNVNSICSKCINELEKALNFLSLSLSNNELLERLSTVDTKMEVLMSTGDDGSFESIKGRNDLRIERTDEYTVSDIKEEIFDHGLDRSSKNSRELGENKPLHTSIDIKEDIPDNDFVFYCGPNDLESCTRTPIERKSSDNNQEQIEVGTETDQLRSPKDQEHQPIEDKPFKCDYCGKSFSDKRALRKHFFIHNEVKPYKCDCCGRTFADKSTLRNHLLTHTGERPFKCDYCSKEYSQKKSLQTHLLTHSRGKPFRCDYCDKNFTYNSNLQRHLLTHTGEKPFECDYCRKGYARNDKLQNHLLTHTE